MVDKLTPDHIALLTTLEQQATRKIKTDTRQSSSGLLMATGSPRSPHSGCPGMPKILAIPV